MITAPSGAEPERVTDSRRQGLAAAAPRATLARWLLGLSASILLVACGESELPSDSESVARVGGAPVSYRQFQEFVSEVTGDSGSDLESEVLSALFEQFLLEEQLRRLAIERRLVSAEASRQAALMALLGSEEVAAASEAELVAYYRDHASEFVRPERVHLRQILVEDRSAAEEATSELAAGVPFAEVAARLSIDPSAAIGGDQGELTREDLPLALAEAIFALETGEVSEVLEAAYGFHIFQVVEHLPAEELSLEEARSEVATILATRAADRRRAELAAEARERYNLEIVPGNLPFRYTGGEGVPEQPE